MAQYLILIDRAVLNVSIIQLIDDVDMTVTTIQDVIAFSASPSRWP